MGWLDDAWFPTLILDRSYCNGFDQLNIKLDMDKDNLKEIVYATVGFAMCTALMVLTYIGIWIFH